MRRRSSGVRRRAEPSHDVADEVAQASRAYAHALPSKLKALVRAIDRAKTKSDVEALVVARSLAHRLAGTAGCYGFKELGELADSVDGALWPAFSASGVEAIRAWAEIEATIARIDALVVMAA